MVKAVCGCASMVSAGTDDGVPYGNAAGRNSHPDVGPCGPGEGPYLPTRPPHENWSGAPCPYHADPSSRIPAAQGAGWCDTHSGASLSQEWEEVESYLSRSAASVRGRKD